MTKVSWVSMKLHSNQDGTVYWNCTKCSGVPEGSSPLNADIWELCTDESKFLDSMRIHLKQHLQNAR